MTELDCFFIGATTSEAVEDEAGAKDVAGDEGPACGEVSRTRAVAARPFVRFLKNGTTGSSSEVIGAFDVASAMLSSAER